MTPGEPPTAAFCADAAYLLAHLGDGDAASATAAVLRRLISKPSLAALGDPRRLPAAAQQQVAALDAALATAPVHGVCRAAAEYLVDALSAGRLGLRAARTLDGLCDESLCDESPDNDSPRDESRRLGAALQKALVFRAESQAFFVAQQATLLLAKENIAETRSLIMRTLGKLDKENLGNRLHYLKDNCLLFYLGSLLQGHSVAPTLAEITYFQQLEKASNSLHHDYYIAIGSYVSYLLTVIQGNPSPRKLYTALSRFKALSSNIDNQQLLVFHWQEPVPMNVAIHHDSKGWLYFIQMDIDRISSTKEDNETTQGLEQGHHTDDDDEDDDGDDVNISNDKYLPVYRNNNYHPVPESNHDTTISATDIINARKQFPLGHKCNTCKTPRSEKTRLKQCQHCHSVYYCSLACQKQAWDLENHKRYCRAVGVFRVGDVVRIHGILLEHQEESFLNSCTGHVVWSCNKEKSLWTVVVHDLNEGDDDGDVDGGGTDVSVQQKQYRIKNENMRLLVTREEVLDVYREAGEQAPFYHEDDE